VHFRDPRLLGRLEPLPARALTSAKAIAALGVDPLVDGLTPATLRGALGSTSRELKVALMDQTKVAGLGNIHAAEALFRARLHPRRTPASLSQAEWARLCRAIHAALAFGLAQAGNADDIEYVEERGAPNPFLVYGRQGTPCSRCGTTVEAFTQAGRTTHFCPACQPSSDSAPRASRTRR
jgi:formamidopyrimidine-DNA glycosylase